MKMSHKNPRTLLNMAQDGHLSSKAQIELETHLRACAECRTYADELAQLDIRLAQKLSAVWAIPPVSQAKLAQTLAVVNTDQRRYQRWQPIWQGAGMALKLSFAVITFVSLFFFFRPMNEPNEESTETAVPAIDSEAFEAPAPYINAHFDFVISGGMGSAQFTHPACDGVAYAPQTDTLLEKLAEGQVPECELVASNTLLFQPGETREVLLVFRNYQTEAIQFSFVPATDLGAGQPFADALCGTGTPFPSGRPNCRQYQVSGNGIWAKFFTFTAPESVAPGTNLNISILFKSSK